MLKRVGLFLLTNFLVVIAISVILHVITAVFGIQITGIYGLAIFCGIFGMTGAFISLWISRWSAKMIYSIELIDGKSNDYRLNNIYNMVARLARQAGINQVPEIGIYHSPEANAFATGPSKDKALVAFSTGIIESMNEKELEAVAAHEITHIANGDMVTMTLLTGIANALVMFLARIVASLIAGALKGDDEEGEGLGFLAQMLLVMVLESLFMVLAAIPLAYFSRIREFKADAGAAKLTNPQHMIDALRSLASIHEVNEKGSDMFATAKISSSKKVSLWATHPSIEDRIARLQGRM